MPSTTVISAIKDIGTQQHSLLSRLDAKLTSVFEDVQQSELYRLVASEKTPQPLVLAVLRNLLREVYSYGKDIVEATFIAIGRMPLEGAGLMRSATKHILDEVTHPGLALKDYLKLGGDEAAVRGRRMSPPAFAMTATCRALAQRDDPFSYLGFMYLFESLTPLIAQQAQKFIGTRQMAQDAMKFIDLHAVEDIKHIEWMRDLIERVVARSPESEAAIEYGFDCFRQVYPLPVWKAALESAKHELTSA